MPSPRRQRSIIEQAAASQRLPASLLWGIYGAETDFGRNVAVSRAGAQGPFQFMPETARGLGINPHNFRQAAFGAAKYIAPYFRKGGARAALIAYNAGPGRIGGPLPDETQAYIPKALQLAKSWKGGGGQAGGGSGGGGGGAIDPGLLIPGIQGAQSAPMGSQGLVTLLQELQGPKQAPSSGGLASPAFAAGPTLAGQSPSSSSGPQPKPDVGKMLELIRTQGGDVQLAPGVGAMLVGGDGQPAAASGAGTGGRPGKVTIAPGANRKGADLNPAVVQFVRQVAGLYGRPLTIGTGTNHNRLTVNGTVSDHWSGNGADIPLTGKALIRAGQDALIAAGMPAKKARRITGGGFNVGGYQVIFNTDAPGWGDHTTHLHVGRRAR